MLQLTDENCILDTYTILDQTPLPPVCANTNYDDRYVWELYVDFV